MKPEHRVGITVIVCCCDFLAIDNQELSRRQVTYAHLLFPFDHVTLKGNVKKMFRQQFNIYVFFLIYMYIQILSYFFNDQALKYSRKHIHVCVN